MPYIDLMTFFIYYVLGITSRKKTVNCGPHWARLEPYWAAVKLPGKRANTRAVKCQLIHVCEYRLHLTASLAAKLGLTLGYRRPAAAAHGPLAGCLFARPPARLLSRSPVSAHAQVTSLSLPLSLTLSIMLTLMCCCSCSFVRRLSVEHLRVLVLSCDRLGFPARHLIAGTHRQAGRQPGNNQNNRKSKMLQ